MMRPARHLLCAVGLAAALAACTAKPTEEQCEKAVANIHKVTGHSQPESGSARGAAVRSCRAQSSRDTVECYIAAQTVDDLFGCGGELADAVRAAQKKQEGSDSASPTGAGAGAGASGSGAGGQPASEPGKGSGAGQ